MTNKRCCKSLGVVAFVAMVLVMMSIPLHAGTFPSKDLKLIVPFGAGGGNDVACRFVAKFASESLDGKKMIVENMPGAGGMKGQGFVAKSKADGYTLLGYSSSVVKNSMMKEAPYSYKDFQPLAMYCYDPMFLVVPSDSPYNTFDEFMSAAKEKGISMNTSGHSSGPHIIALMVQSGSDGATFNYVHANSSAIQVQQLLGSHVDAGFMSSGEASAQVEAGALKVLVTSGKERHEAYPDVPTLQEKGIDVVYGAVRGLALPKDAPEEVVQYLDKAFENIINDQKFIDAMAQAGFPVVYRNSSDFTEYMNDYADNFAKILPMLNTN